MKYFCILILASFFAINSLDKVESVQLEELPLQTFDELFVDEWWDKDEAEDLKTPAPTNFGQNVHHQIDRQNTQIGQIESNSTDQNPSLTESYHSEQIEPNSTDQNPPLTKSDHLPLQTFDESFLEGWWDNDHQINRQNSPLGQIEPNSTDQNPSLTEFDHSDNAKNGEKQNKVSSNKNITKDEQKRKIVVEFHAMKEELKQKGKYSKKERTQIEDKIAKHLKVNRKKIYKWKKEFGLSQRNPKNERKNLVDKFDQRKAELKRAGLKSSYPNQINETVAKELGLGFRTIYNWKRKLGQTAPNYIYSYSEQKELMKRYYKIKDQNPKISDGEIAKTLKIVGSTLYKWKKQINPNSVDGHSVEENAAANVQEIGNFRGAFE